MDHAKRPLMPRLPHRCQGKGLVRCGTKYDPTGRPVALEYEFHRHGRTIRLALIEGGPSSTRPVASRRVA